MKLLALACCLSVAVGQNLPTVPELNPIQYIGRWFQVYGNRYGWWQYDEYAICNIAQYGVFTPTLVTVRNWNRNVTVDGPVDEIRGWAERTEAPGKFKVQLEEVPFVADYWVVKLGPVNSDDLYDFAVVTNPDSTSLYVLARDVARFKQQYETEVLDFLRQSNFTGEAIEPIEIAHPAGCQYPTFP